MISLGVLNAYDICPNYEWHEPCDTEQNPGTCTEYDPKDVQVLLDKIEEFKAELEKFKNVDEDKVDRLAVESWNNLRKFASAPHVAEAWNDYIHGFKAGYRKAKEE